VPWTVPNGTIFLHRLGNAKGASSALFRCAPKDARKAFEKGSLWQKEQAGRCHEELPEAVDVYPSMRAWFELGKLQAAKQADAAHQSFDAAVEADPST